MYYGNMYLLNIFGKVEFYNEKKNIPIAAQDLFKFIPAMEIRVFFASNSKSFDTEGQKDNHYTKKISPQ